MGIFGTQKMMMCTPFFFAGEGVSESKWFVHSWKCWHLWMAPNTSVYTLTHLYSHKHVHTQHNGQTTRIITTTHNAHVNVNPAGGPLGSPNEFWQKMFLSESLTLPWPFPVRDLPPKIYISTICIMSEYVWGGWGVSVKINIFSVDF